MNPSGRAHLAARLGLDADSTLLGDALTHRSAASLRARSNERLEFLGDALIGQIVAARLFSGLPEAADEGTLSRCRMAVVRQETLAEAGRTLGLPELLSVGAGERREGRQYLDRLVAGAFEALVAVIHLERGAAAAARFVEDALAGPLSAVLSSPPGPDPKTELQERLQAARRGLPVYTQTAAGPPVRVEVADGAGVPLASGEAASKRLAEREAARQALAALTSTEAP